jgi:hypothetical protein
MNTFFVGTYYLLTSNHLRLLKYNRILPLLVKGRDDTQNMTRLLNAISAEQRVLPATLSTVFHALVPRIRKHYKLPRREKPCGTVYKTDCMNLSTFITNCTLYSLHHHTLKLLEQIFCEFNTLRIYDFHTTLLPFLRHLASTWTKSAFYNESAFPEFQKLFQEALHLYITKYVEHEPEAPKTARPPIHCNRNQPCSCCATFNAFLQNPRQTKKIDFKLVKPAEYEHCLPEHKALERRDMHVKITPGARWMYVELTNTTKQFDGKIKLWKAKRDRAQVELDKFDEEALVRMLGDTYREIAGIRCARLEPWGSIPRIVLPLPPVRAQRETYAPPKVEGNASPRAQENEQVRVDLSSEHHQSLSPKQITEAGSNVASAISNITNATLHLRPHQAQSAKKVEDEETETKIDIEPRGPKRRAEEGETTGCVRYKPPKRSKKRVALEDACTLFGM